ncbi:hypothetical protein [Adhaeribacter aquaticus]|uniref:hypothetical protein n=1 Tax=Adhaeribacter aquaticus TaxID=299567 RepID=UPI0004153085|nr:hypothetical protein [Adhaeribacter aquaticus]
MEAINLDRFAYRFNDIAIIRDCSPQTPWNDAHRMPYEPNFLRAFKISESQARCLNTDVAKYLKKLRPSWEITSYPYLIPNHLELAVYQIADLLNCSETIIRQNINRKKGEEHYNLHIKSIPGSKTDFRVFYKDVLDFINRNYICELELAA